MAKTTQDPFVRAHQALQAQANIAMELFPFDKDGNPRNLDRKTKRAIRTRLRQAQDVMREFRHECATVIAIVQDSEFTIPTLNEALLWQLLTAAGISADAPPALDKQPS